MMDYGMGWGMGWGWHWLGMIVFWLLPLLVVIVLVVSALKYLSSRGARSDAGLHEDRNRALEVLAERYARGDINREEYLQKRDGLKWR